MAAASSARLASSAMVTGAARGRRGWGFGGGSRMRPTLLLGDGMKKGGSHLLAGLPASAAWLTWALRD